MSDYRAPSASPAGPEKDRLHGLLLAAVLGLLSVAAWKHAYYEIFRQFSPWDDEGTMMSLVKGFLDGGVLFDEVRSPGYGPFYYLHKALLYGATGSPVTHDANRLLAVAFWVACALGCAWIVNRLTRSVAASAFALLLAVPQLRCFANEPGHPQEVGMLLVVAGVLAGTWVHRERARGPAAFAIGGLAAALFLTKVNLGFFLALAAGLAGVVFFRRGRRLPAWILGTGAVALPFFLMLADLGSEWGLSYAVVVAGACASALVVASGGEPRAPGGIREFLLACGGFGAVTLISCVVVMARGTSLRGLADGILLERLALYTEDGGFVIPAVVGYGAIIATAASLGIALWYAGRLGTGRAAATLKAMAAMKLVWAALVAYWVLFDRPYANNFLLAYGTPFAWLVLVRGEDSSRPRGDSGFSRAFLCFGAVVHALIAYPVHGSQALLAGLLLIPLAAVCARDALRELLAPSLARWPDGRRTRLRIAGLVVGVAAVSAYAWTQDIPRLRAAYEAGTPLELPGAARIRLPAGDVETYHWLVEDIEAHCDGFFGIPMYPSLYFWTGYEPPTTAFDAWIAVFDEAWEARAVERIRQYERPCIVRNERGQRFWTARLRDGGRDDGPIERYAREEFTTVAERDGYELLTLAKP